jgi:hypothetical protein
MAFQGTGDAVGPETPPPGAAASCRWHSSRPVRVEGRPRRTGTLTGAPGKGREEVDGREVGGAGCPAP